MKSQDLQKSQKVTIFRDSQKQGLGQAFTQGPKIDQFLTNLIKQTSKYKKYHNNIKINSKLLLKLYKPIKFRSLKTSKNRVLKCPKSGTGFFQKFSKKSQKMVKKRAH